MRSDARAFELIAPPTLQAVLHRLAEQPGQHAVIAGGTELMVALNTGRLQSHSLLSIQHLRELRFIRETGEAIEIGGGSTFTDIRRSQLIAAHLPLLTLAASWTGSIANQNRGTLGGNICNASPAADTPPALLGYDAILTLISASGTRQVRYCEFHRSYKKTALRHDELLFSVTVPRPHTDARQYIRKVGTRNAQAISKVAVAVVAQVTGHQISRIRIGAASLADRPLRCFATEEILTNRSLDAASAEGTIRQARAALSAEAKPIDDIRSTGKYRRAVAANLLEEFLRSL